MKVVLLNPADRVRAEVRSLCATLPDLVEEVVVVLSGEASEEAVETDGVTYREFSATYVPGIRYTLPHRDFVEVLAGELRDADVLHVASYIYPPCLAAVLLGNREGVATVVTVDAFPGRDWSYGNPAVDTIARGYTRLVGQPVLSRADRIVGLGRYLTLHLREITDRERIRIIPNGIDVETFSPPEQVAASRSPSTRTDGDGGGSSASRQRPTDSSNGPVRLLYVGRLDRVKGVPYLVEALDRLTDRDGRRYELTIVGDGSKRDEYERQCASKSLTDVVEFVGWQDDVVHYYEAADVFVLPSLSEGQPTVLMEAQACGLPVVTTDVGGARAVTGAGRTVPPRDPGALADAIEDVADSDLDALGQQARDHVVSNFSRGEMARQYVDTYRELCR